MKKLIIFGVGDVAELAYFYFSNESNYNVMGFAVDKEFMDKKIFHSLPVVAYEELPNKFPPNEYELFIAMSYAKVNKYSAEKYLQIKRLGYSLASFVSSKATNYAESIGENCFILEDNTIQPFVEIGNNVTLWSGNHIGHHSVIEDHCFITSQVVISGGCTIGELSFIGVNSTLRDHIEIGKSNVIGAGSLIMADSDDFNVFISKPTEVAQIASNRLRNI